MARRTIRDATAGRSRQSLRMAVAQGPRPIRLAASASAVTGPCRSLHPGLRHHPVELGVELEIPQPLRDEVYVLGREERGRRRLVGYRLVNLSPQLIRTVGIAD